MAFTLTIPDDLLRAIKLPYQQIQGELIKEIAFTLYARGLVSMGIARQFADMSKWAFIEGLAERDIQRHYYDREADEDISYARSCE